MPADTDVSHYFACQPLAGTITDLYRFALDIIYFGSLLLKPSLDLWYAEVSNPLVIMHAQGLLSHPCDPWDMVRLHCVLVDPEHSTEFPKAIERCPKFISKSCGNGVTDMSVVLSISTEQRMQNKMVNYSFGSVDGLCEVTVLFSVLLFPMSTRAEDEQEESLALWEVTDFSVFNFQFYKMELLLI